MTTPNHAVMTFIISRALGLPTWASLACAFDAMMPDIIGYAEKKIKKDDNLWRWYVYCHTFHWWQLFLPEWLLHTTLDSLTHTEHGWKPWAYYIEYFTWALYLIYLIRELIL